MRRRASILSLLTITASVLAAPGCDWIHYTFMNSIPFHGNNSKKDVDIYLGIDGLSYFSVLAARSRGAFSESDWRLAKFITMFPGTSDASWTRILHSPKLAGYEFSHYDPTSDSVKNSGLLGLAMHVMPSITRSISFEPPYLHAFDYRANGHTHGFYAYRDTFVSSADTLDNLFYILDGRVQTSSVFSAYVLEIDVMGHMQSRDDITDTLVRLSDRIARFRGEHPDLNLRFTFLSDHGMDFLHVPEDKFIEFDQELPRVGIQAVASLNNRNPDTELYAIPIVHTRLTYVGLHTHRRLVPEIARRVTRLESVDLSVGRIQTPPQQPEGGPPDLEWFGIWGNDRMIAYFGFDARSDRYYLPSTGDYTRLGNIPLRFAPGEAFKVFGDDELFHFTKHLAYPDLFYRVRTGLSAVGIDYPADVLVSLNPHYTSAGAKIPGASAGSANSAFHGSLQDLGSVGTLFSQKRDLPDAVRSDTFMALFPQMREHMESLGVEYIDGDPNSAVGY